MPSKSSLPTVCGRGGPPFWLAREVSRGRLATIEAAGLRGLRSRPVFSSVSARLDAERWRRVALRESNERHGNLQEIIIQNFGEGGEMMADEPAPDIED